MALRDASNEIEMQELQIRDRKKNLRELESDETDKTDTLKETQTKSGSSCRSEDEAEVASNSIWKKKCYYCKKFFRSLFYEMLWSAWFLLAFLVFQRNCK